MLAAGGSSLLRGGQLGGSCSDRRSRRLAVLSPISPVVAARYQQGYQSRSPSKPFDKVPGVRTGLFTRTQGVGEVGEMDLTRAAGGRHRTTLTRYRHRRRPRFSSLLLSAAPPFLLARQPESLPPVYPNRFRSGTLLVARAQGAAGAAGIGLGAVAVALLAFKAYKQRGRGCEPPLSSLPLPPLRRRGSASPSFSGGEWLGKPAGLLADGPASAPSCIDFVWAGTPARDFARFGRQLYRSHDHFPGRA